MSISISAHFGPMQMRRTIITVELEQRQLTLYDTRDLLACCCFDDHYTEETGLLRDDDYDYKLLIVRLHTLMDYEMTIQ